jgi:hypothetical protein
LAESGHSNVYLNDDFNVRYCPKADIALTVNRCFQDFAADRPDDATSGSIGGSIAIACFRGNVLMERAISNLENGPCSGLCA